MYISKKQIKKNPLKIILKIFNKIYLKNKEHQNKELLNNVMGQALDKKQKQIVLSEEDSSLVIAPAGSGKSLTIIGRILYLVKNKTNPKDILVISFTNKTCNSLKNKLNKNNINIEVKTFHKLGRDILKNNGYPISLTKENTLSKIIEENINKSKNIHEIMSWVNFHGNNDNYLKNELLKASPQINQLKKQMHTFINLFKANGYTENKFKEFLNKNKLDKPHIKNQNHAFLLLAKKIYIEYQTHLKKHKQIDFHDMISKSIDIVKQNSIYPYKYIIIDEYQDSSLIKCNLIKAIKQKTNAKLMAVGDDFQSIYQFTGSNLEIFTNFKAYFPTTKIFKLNRTYRNSVELLKITNKFILKNPNQIYKKINSNKHNKTPIIIYYYNKSYFPLVEKLQKSLEGNTLILGRNNADIEKIKGNKLTIHKSKGLQSDNTIIVNLSNKINGLPNKIINNDVLKYVTKKENYPYEEERRLFYVALTRTKNTNYLLVDKNNPSQFIQEILKDNKNIIEHK